MQQEVTEVRTQIISALDVLLPVNEEVNQRLGLKELTVDEVVSGIIGRFTAEGITIPDPEKSVRTQLPALMKQRGYRTEYNPDYDADVFIKSL